MSSCYFTEVFYPCYWEWKKSQQRSFLMVLTELYPEKKYNRVARPGVDVRVMSEVRHCQDHLMRSWGVAACHLSGRVGFP